MAQHILDFTNIPAEISDADLIRELREENLHLRNWGAALHGKLNAALDELDDAERKYKFVLEINQRLHAMVADRAAGQRATVEAELGRMH